ncbi:3103_t:CDS:2 [Acaulospora colombiana]|uniref:3103_t:CDS:1 n=1 Tax=Acaulospora colombiana TaxID=27376 RepID=A0ACA9MZR3_9GLOM|nr:3103_t:CDS:2 [Acaulospora colombiana]
MGGVRPALSDSGAAVVDSDRSDYQLTSRLDYDLVAHQVVRGLMSDFETLDSIEEGVLLGPSKKSFRRLLPVIIYIGDEALEDAIQLLQVQDLFWKFIRVTLETFNLLANILQDHPVFYNQSTNGQISVEEQVAITLYHLGHCGNGVSLTKIGNWAGCGHGTIHLITQRVLTAIYDSSFRKKAIFLPSEEEKEALRGWAESKSCPEWRNGWCGVDGARDLEGLIPQDRELWGFFPLKRDSKGFRGIQGDLEGFGEGFGGTLRNRDWET